MNFDYRVDGMHCAACVGRVTAALKPFATDIQVTLEPPRAHLTGDRQPRLDALRAAIATAGAYKIAAADEAPARPERVAAVSQDDKSWLATYFPLLLIAGYIAVTALAGTSQAGGGKIDWAAWMGHVMAGFFLVFSAFKLLDLDGFADAYASYDLAARQWHGWGYIYPFLELALGLAYLFRLAPVPTNLATIALMGFSSLGVIRALARQETIRCACLGTVLNVPMSTITLVEDLAMVAMAIMQLALH